MFKRIIAFTCLLVSASALAVASDFIAPGDNCSCAPRLKIGHQPEKLPPVTQKITLHQPNDNEYLIVRMTRVNYLYGFCWHDSCRTQRDCQLGYNLSWEANNPAGGSTWILDIGGPYGAQITHTIPPGTWNPGSAAGTIYVDRCGGDDFITFNLTIDGITVHIPVSIWCNPCEDSDTGF